MSLPEISRRCRSCGAAVRAGARFCPQCGALMAEEDGAAAAHATAEAAPQTREFEPQREAAPATRETETPRESEPPRAQEPQPRAEPPDEWAPPTKEYAAFVQSIGGADGRGAAEAPRAEGGAAEPVTTAAGDAGAVMAGDAAAVAAEGVRAGRVARAREAGRARVERMREEAIVVLEETPDDSGLRFVAAAAALFLVFLFLLILSTTVLR